MKSLLEILLLSTTYLQERGIANARRQAEELFCDALGLNRMQLYLNFERPLTEEELTLCRERLVRRAKGEPVQYIHGSVEFYDCSFVVNPAVLIPRQETEILVDKVVKELTQQDLTNKILWDICCGSGCIGIALKKRFPELQVVLSDNSAKALEVAAQNAKKNQVEVEFLQGDLLNPFKNRKAHFIVCNPPYLAEKEYSGLDIEVKSYEPKSALVAGPVGIEYYERLAKELPSYLYPQARVWLEIGYQQGKVVKDLFCQNFVWQNAQVENDWSGQSRFFSVTYVD